MSAKEGYDPSVWNDPEHRAKVPKKCPHCDRALAHPDDLRDNEEIRVTGLFRAYREHRQAHFRWGDDPETHGSKPGDPYLGSYYDTNRDALWEPEDAPSGDPDEVVGHVFNVTIHYQAQASGTVVAPNKSAAKEKLKELKMSGEEDKNGRVPEVVVTDEVHSDAFQKKDVTRSDTELAERMEGWPW